MQGASQPSKVTRRGAETRATIARRNAVIDHKVSAPRPVVAFLSGHGVCRIGRALRDNAPCPHLRHYPNTRGVVDGLGVSSIYENGSFSRCADIGGLLAPLRGCRARMCLLEPRFPFGHGISASASLLNLRGHLVEGWSYGVHQRLNVTRELGVCFQPLVLVRSQQLEFPQ